MRFVAPILQFLKRHYEKIILCVVLLGLAGAATWMGAEISKYKAATGPSPDAPRNKPVPPVDLSSDISALQGLTNPPPVVLSGDHNLFNPVTWKRENNGRLLKILRTGPDALKIVDVAPLYTVISYDHPTGTAGIYVFTVQTNSGRRMIDEHPKLDEKTKSGLYIVHGIKGAADSPSDLQLVITATQQKVWITHDNPYKQVDGHTVDLFYPPENHNMAKQHVNEVITLDGQRYKIVEITDDTVRVQDEQNSKITTVRKQ